MAKRITKSVSLLELSSSWLLMDCMVTKRDQTRILSLAFRYIPSLQYYLEYCEENDITKPESMQLMFRKLKILRGDQY